MRSETQPEETRIDGIKAPTELLGEFTQLTRRFERKIESLTAVNPTDRVVMETLLRRGSLSPSELADAARITPAAMTASIDRLSDMGHVIRENNPHDRRKVIVTPCDASVKLIMDELRAMIVDIDQVLKNYSDDELALITEFLGSVNKTYERHVEGVS